LGSFKRGTPDFSGLGGTGQFFWGPGGWSPFSLIAPLLGKGKTPEGDFGGFSNPQIRKM